MDPQILQTLIVALIVAIAAFFMGARVVRAVSAARRKKDGCGGDCCS